MNMSSEWLLKRWISFASYFPTTRAGFAPEHIVIVAGMLLSTTRQLHFVE